MDSNGNGQTPSTTLVLTISLDQLTGAVSVNGPIQVPWACMGMLEMAKEAILKQSRENPSRIALPGSMQFVQH